MTKQRGSLRAIKMVSKLPSTAVRTIWMVLAAWTEDDTGQFYITSQSELADTCGFKRETTNRALKYLVNAGLLTRLGRSTEGKKTRYQMHFDCDPQVTAKVTPRSQPKESQSDTQVTGVVTQGSQGCDTQVTLIEEGTVIPTVKGTVTLSPDAKKRKVEKKEWVYPDWWAPLTELPGYVKRDYTRTAENIRAACGEGGTDPAEVVEDFAEYFKINRFRHGWREPTQALNRTIEIQIKKVVNKRGGSRNGRTEQRGPDKYERLVQQYSGEIRGADTSPRGEL